MDTLNSAGASVPTISKTKLTGSDAIVTAAPEARTAKQHASAIHVGVSVDSLVESAVRIGVCVRDGSYSLHMKSAVLAVLHPLGRLDVKMDAIGLNLGNSKWSVSPGLQLLVARSSLLVCCPREVLCM